VFVEVKGGGVLGSRKNIKITGGKHEILPVLQPADELDLMNYVLKAGFDFVALPYSIRKKDI